MTRHVWTFDEVVICLDGSNEAEEILPLAHLIASAKGAALTIVRVVADSAELVAEGDGLRALAHRYHGQLHLPVSADPAGAVAALLAEKPHAIAALTTHGRTAWGEAILGGVALRVIRESKRPALLWRPLDPNRRAPKRIATIAVALDGSKFAEHAIEFAAPLAKILHARLVLLQALPTNTPPRASIGRESMPALESAYLHRQAADIKEHHAIDCQWDVLHGDPGAALCRYLNGMDDVIVAMTTHARAGLERAVLGSVAAHCVRHAGVPILLYWPEEKRTA